jgi:hypothetical protein
MLAAWNLAMARSFNAKGTRSTPGLTIGTLTGCWIKTQIGIGWPREKITRNTRSTVSSWLQFAPVAGTTYNNKAVGKYPILMAIICRSPGRACAQGCHDVMATCYPRLSCYRPAAGTAFRNLIILIKILPLKVLLLVPQTRFASDVNN